MSVVSVYVSVMPAYACLHKRICGVACPCGSATCLSICLWRVLPHRQTDRETDGPRVCGSVCAAVVCAAVMCAAVRLVLLPLLSCALLCRCHCCGRWPCRLTWARRPPAAWRRSSPDGPPSAPTPAPSPSSPSAPLAPPPPSPSTSPSQHYGRLQNAATTPHQSLVWGAMLRDPARRPLIKRRGKLNRQVLRSQYWKIVPFRCAPHDGRALATPRRAAVCENRPGLSTISMYY